MDLALLTLALVTGLPHLALAGGTIVLARHINSIIGQNVRHAGQSPPKTQQKQWR